MSRHFLLRSRLWQESRFIRSREDFVPWRLSLPGCCLSLEDRILYEPCSTEWEATPMKLEFLNDILLVSTYSAKGRITTCKHKLWKLSIATTDFTKMPKWILLCRFPVWLSTIKYTFPFMNLGSWESLCISLDCEGRLEPPRQAVLASTRGGGDGHRVLPEDLFLSNEERRWQLLTLCSQRTRDEVRSSISSFSFFFLSQWWNPATECLVTVCPLFIINQYAFNSSDPGSEAFLSKFKTLCVCSVLDI